MKSLGLLLLLGILVGCHGKTTPVINYVMAIPSNTPAEEHCVQGGCHQVTVLGGGGGGGGVK